MKDPASDPSLTASAEVKWIDIPALPTLPPPGSAFWVLLPVCCGVAFSVLLFSMASDRQVWLAVSPWISFSMWPVFWDLSITLQHLQEAELGLDPLGDPASEFAYPRTVLLLRYLGVHHVQPEILGLLQGVVLTIAVVLVLRPFTPRRAIGTSLLFFTPAVMLGLERANLDFALFLLCAAAAWGWARSTRSRNVTWPIAAAIVGALLKLYPVFALVGGAVAESGRRRACWLGGAALVAAYWFLNRAELSLVLAKVPVAASASWGALVFFVRLERVLQTEYAAEWFAQLPWRMIGVGFYAVAVLVATLIGLRLAKHFKAVQARRTEWAFFWCGAAICCGCFVGANFAYRWVFALLTLPLLLRNLRTTAPGVELWSRCTLALLLIGVATPLRTFGGVFVLVQLVNWAFISLLVIGCVAMRQGNPIHRAREPGRRTRKRLSPRPAATMCPTAADEA